MPGLHPRQLARACSGQRSRRDQLHHRSDARYSPDALANFVAEAAAFLIAADPAVDEDGRRFFARRASNRESRDVARFETGQLLDRPLDVLRPVVAAVDDDHVFRAADDEDVARRHVAHVASVEPTVAAEARLGRFLVAEVAVHHALAADIDLTDAAVGKDFAARAANINLPHGAWRPTL